MSNPGHIVDRPDPIIEYYKQFVDREALRANLKLAPEERLMKLQARADEANKDGLLSLRLRVREVIDELISAKRGDSENSQAISRLCELRDEIDRVAMQ